MSKTATLKNLPTPSELRQSVQELASLEQLPDLVAHEVNKSIAPLLALRQDVVQVLAHYDQLMKVQRQSLEAMALELGDRATKGMETKAAGLHQVITDLASQVQVMKSSMETLESASKGMQSLPVKLTKAATDAATEMMGSAGRLSSAAEEVRPSAWLTLALMLGASLLGALLVAGGQVVLNRLVPPSETQQSADWAAAVWTKATPAEKKLMDQIVSRPAR